MPEMHDGAHGHASIAATQPPAVRADIQYIRRGQKCLSRGEIAEWLFDFSTVRGQVYILESRASGTRPVRTRQYTHTSPSGAHSGITGIRLTQCPSNRQDSRMQRCETMIASQLHRHNSYSLAGSGHTSGAGSSASGAAQRAPQCPRACRH